MKSDMAVWEAELELEQDVVDTFEDSAFVNSIISNIIVQKTDV